MTVVDVAVVGAGIAGAAASRSLASAGRSVVTFEQFEIGHQRGSSHGTSRIFRLSYDQPRFVAMAMEALPLWREIEEQTGRTLLTIGGGLDSGARVDAHARALEACGARYEVMSGGDASRRWPQVDLPADRSALWHPDAGIVHADVALRTFIQLAVDAGTELREGERVTHLEVSKGRVAITTNGDTYSAAVVVVTAGAWAKSLLAQVGIDLPVTATRETVAYFSINDARGLPTLVDWEDPPLFGLSAPGTGLKAGLHHAGPVADPNENGRADDGSVAHIAEWVGRRYPKADPAPVLTETCLYTNTEDEGFIFERHGPIVVGSACSGHGFKFGPLHGRRLAELVIKES
ncbi:MAG: FAD-dependent oxidoreductase [Actinomycetota bacterium]